jgi:hypothetical protein
MAEYVPFSPNVEVNGETVLSFSNALPSYGGVMQQVLSNNGIKNPLPGKWYKQKDWLNAFKQIGEEYGPHTLFLIGNAIPKNAIFPKNIVTLEDALNSINIAYHTNHRKGDIGYYKLLSIDIEQKRAVMECKNPYPSHFDMGIIISMARMYKMKSTDMIDIERDETMPSRTKGADSCTYNLHW